VVVPPTKLFGALVAGMGCRALDEDEQGWNAVRARVHAFQCGHDFRWVIALDGREFYRGTGCQPHEFGEPVFWAVFEKSQQFSAVTVCDEVERGHVFDNPASSPHGYRAGFHLFDGVDQSRQPARVLAPARLDDPEKVCSRRWQVVDDKRDAEVLDEEVETETATGGVTQCRNLLEAIDQEPY
jgi:hypothetical protein